MARYIALLRGINVGGNNKVPMAELRHCFEELGFSSVSTYINSGNVMFETTETEPATLKRQIETELAKTFGFQIATTVISATELQKYLANAPSWWGVDTTAKHNAIFVIPPTTPDEIIEAVGPYNPEYEQVSFSGQLIFWSAPIKTISRTRWIRIVGTKPYQSLTIRNANTTKKLLELVSS